MYDSKEIARKALNHLTPERVPVDFGSTPVTGIHVTCIAELRQYYGLECRPVKVIEPYQMLGEIEDDLLEVIGVDTFQFPNRYTMFGFENKDWKEFMAPWGQLLLVPQSFYTTKDLNGDILIYPQGDSEAPPSARMPIGSFFFDTIIRQETIDDKKLDPSNNLEEFNILSDDDLKWYSMQAKIMDTSNRAIVGGIWGTAFGDIALVPAPFLKHPKGIRDIEEWYISTITRQDYIHQVFSKQCEIAIENLKRIYPIFSDIIDIIYICGTDFGTQRSTFCSIETYENLYSPYYRKINDWIHQNTTWKTFKHSCGAIESFIPYFIDSGFDIINPVQCSATGMNPKELKEKYGANIVFWGGGVDTQKTLPFGTPEQVRKEVLQRCEIFSSGGGFVFSSIHNIQAKTPVKNIVAMIDALKEFNNQ